MHAILWGGSLVIGGYDKKGSNGWLSTIPILNVFGRLERRSREGMEKERRDTERRENWVVAHHVVIQHLEQKLTGGCVKITVLVVWHHKKDRLNHVYGHWNSPSIIFLLKHQLWTMSRGNSAVALQRVRGRSVTWLNPSVSEEQSVWLASSSSSSELSRALEQALSWLWGKHQLTVRQRVHLENFHTFGLSKMGPLCLQQELWT